MIEAINLHGDHRSQGTDDRGIKQDFLFAGGGRVNFRGNTLLKPALARQSILFNLTFINIYREAAGSAACFSGGQFFGKLFLLLGVCLEQSLTGGLVAKAQEMKIFPGRIRTNCFLKGLLDIGGDVFGGPSSAFQANFSGMMTDGLFQCLQLLIGKDFPRASMPF